MIAAMRYAVIIGVPFLVLVIIHGEHRFVVIDKGERAVVAVDLIIEGDVLERQMVARVTELRVRPILRGESDGVPVVFIHGLEYAVKVIIVGQKVRAVVIEQRGLVEKVLLRGYAHIADIDGIGADVDRGILAETYLEVYVSI